MGHAHPALQQAAVPAKPPTPVNRQAIQKAQAWHQRNDAHALKLQQKYDKDTP